MTFRVAHISDSHLSREKPFFVETFNLVVATLTDGVRHVWASSTGFVIPDSRQPRYGKKEVGYVEHR